MCLYTYLHYFYCTCWWRAEVRVRADRSRCRWHRSGPAWAQQRSVLWPDMWMSDVRYPITRHESDVWGFDIDRFTIPIHSGTAKSLSISSLVLGKTSLTCPNCPPSTDSWPGAGVHHDLVVAAEGESAAAALQQVADPPQLVQLRVDLADVLQVQLKYFSVWQKYFN